ncbi:uncharacterized protein LOC143624650 [Bidens hawaiensis]|uniref:uncharacterized protein LOC143624650 n=1 Tax=Bidens hawaiensis TaxID=980011 RepID=UPI004048EFE9
MAPHLLLPSPTPDFNFNFDITSTSPYANAPSTPKILFPKEDIDMDFAFDFSGQLEPSSISDADELFDGGIIKPSDPPPVPPSKLAPVSSGSKNLESFSEALRRTPGVQTLNPPPQTQIQPQNQSSLMGFTWYNKWNLKNLLLFWNTSEGSAAKITKEDLKASSFRSCDGSGSVRRMKRKMSAHEMHYTANRAVAEERRRKTSLPYKSGLLGCLRFSHDLRDVSRRR